MVASDRHDGQLQRNLNRVGHRRLQLTVEGGRDHRLARARRAGGSDDAAHGAAWRGYCQHSGVVSPTPGKCLPPSQEATAAIEGEFICPRRSSLLRLQRRPLRTVPSPGARARRGETAPAKKPSVKKPSVKKPSVNGGGRFRWTPIMGTTTARQGFSSSRARFPGILAGRRSGCAALGHSEHAGYSLRYSLRYREHHEAVHERRSPATRRPRHARPRDLETSRPRSATTSTSKAPR